VRVRAPPECSLQLTALVRTTQLLGTAASTPLSSPRPLHFVTRPGTTHLPLSVAASESLAAGPAHGYPYDGASARRHLGFSNPWAIVDAALAKQRLTVPSCVLLPGLPSRAPHSTYHARVERISEAEMAALNAIIGREATRVRLH